MKRDRSRTSRGPFGALALVLLLALAPRAVATDFIRGDVNGDGFVSLADLHAIEMYIYGGAPPPQCLMAADVDDDDHIGYLDTLRLKGFLGAPDDSPPPAPPYPAPGPDPTEAIPDPESPAITCEIYGGDTVLEDPASRIEVRDAIAAGGEDSVVVLTLAVTSPRPSAGFLGRLRVEGGAIGHRNHLQRLDLAFEDGFVFWSGARTIDDSVVFFAESTDLFRTRNPLPAMDVTDLATMTLCLRPGARAGVYPITLEMAEIVEWETARSIRPSVGAGTLTIVEEVHATPDGCSDDPEPSVPVNAEFRVGDAVARAGGSFRVPLTIRSSAEFKGYNVSLDFNEEVLECTGLEQVWQRPEGLPFDFVNYDINNRSVRPGNAEPDEGAVVGLFVLFIFDPQGIHVPADTEIVPFALDFKVRPGVPPGTTTTIHVRDGEMGVRLDNRHPWVNGVEVMGEVRSPTTVTAGQIEIVGEDSEHFVRGDSSGNDRVEVSDAIHTLEHLFLGGPAPRCADAADSNDSGEVDISDPIDTLSFLFLGSTGSLSPPFPGLGTDPTADALACGGSP